MHEIINARRKLKSRDTCCGMEIRGRRRKIIAFFDVT
jgi:hypothetical protein